MEFQQNTLFGEKVISSIGYDEQEIIKDILYLHCGGKMIDCDPCYSIGNFYKNYAKKPRFKFDKFPQAPGVTEATSDKLPLPAQSVEVIMFDPPFVISGEGWQENIKEAKEGSNIIMKRFTAFKSWDDLKDMYSSSLKEFYRILIGGGYRYFQMSRHGIECYESF